MKIFIKNKQKSILSIILVAVIFILNLLPVFALETTRYENVWEKMSQSEKDEWAKFLTGIPKIKGTNPDDVSAKIAENVDIWDFIHFYDNFCNSQEDYSGADYKRNKEKVSIDMMNWDWDTLEKWNDEKDDIMGESDLSDEEKDPRVPYMLFKTRQVAEMLKKHYGLSIYNKGKAII